MRYSSSFSPSVPLTSTHFAIELHSVDIFAYYCDCLRLSLPHISQHYLILALLALLAMSSTSSRSHPPSLQGLTTREQITDVLLRACLALDKNDRLMWESAWAASDPTFELNGNVFTGLDSINSATFNVVGALDTQHNTSSVRVDVQDGASTARLTANALNQHFRAGQGMVPGAPYLLVGHSYDVDLIKDSSGQWKMQMWQLKTVWSQGTWDVLKPEPST